MRQLSAAVEGRQAHSNPDRPGCKHRDWDLSSPGYYFSIATAQSPVFISWRKRTYDRYSGSFRDRAKMCECI